MFSSFLILPKQNVDSVKTTPTNITSERSIDSIFTTLYTLHDKQIVHPTTTICITLEKSNIIVQKRTSTNILTKIK